MMSRGNFGKEILLFLFDGRPLAHGDLLERVPLRHPAPILDAVLHHVLQYMILQSSTEVFFADVFYNIRTGLGEKIFILTRSAVSY